MNIGGCDRLRSSNDTNTMRTRQAVSAGEHELTVDSTSIGNEAIFFDLIHEILNS